MSIGIKVSLISQDAVPPVPSCDCRFKGTARVQRTLLYVDIKGFTRADGLSCINGSNSRDNNYYMIQSCFIDTKVVVRHIFKKCASRYF